MFHQEASVETIKYLLFSKITHTHFYTHLCILNMFVTYNYDYKILQTNIVLIVVDNSLRKIKVVAI